MSVCRESSRNAVSAAAQAEGIAVLYYDAAGIDTDFDLTDSVTHDWSDLQRRMREMYDRWPEGERDEVGGSWFKERLDHVAPNNALFVEAKNTTAPAISSDDGR